MLKEIGSVFSFLTIFPSSNATLESIAKYMYVFPIVGIAIGLLVGSLGFGLSFVLDPLLVSLLVVASLAIVIISLIGKQEDESIHAQFDEFESGLDTMA